MPRSDTGAAWTDTGTGAVHTAPAHGVDDYSTGQRRAFLRFFACEEDWSHEPLDKELPAPVADGREPLLIIGAIAGG